MKKQKQSATTKIDEARATADLYAARLRRVEHEAEGLRIRLDTLARHAARHTPDGIRNHKDMWGVAIEAMSLRAQHVVDLAAGIRN